MAEQELDVSLVELLASIAATILKPVPEGLLYQLIEADRQRLGHIFGTLLSPALDSVLQRPELHPTERGGPHQSLLPNG